MLSFWNWVFFCKGHQFLSLGRFQVLQVTLWGLYLTLEGWGKSWLQESSSHTHGSQDGRWRVCTPLGVSHFRALAVVRSRCMSWWFSVGDHTECSQATCNGKSPFSFWKLSQTKMHFPHVCTEEGCEDRSVTSPDLARGGFTQMLVGQS